MKWLHSFTDSMDMNLTNLQEIEDREPWRAAVHRISKSQIQLKTSKTFLLENNHIHSYIICGPVHTTKSELSHIYIDHIGLLGNVKECSNYHTITFILHASKAKLKILQARLQQYMNRELPDVQAGFRKGRGTRDQIANICLTMEKAREFQKNIYFCFIDYAKAFDCVDHNKLWKIL